MSHGCICALPLWRRDHVKGRYSMKPRTILVLSTTASFALALLSSNVMAQTKSLKDQLVGTSTLVSFERTVNGTKAPVANPKGFLIFDAGGRYVMVGERGDRPKFKSPSQPTTDEL